MTRKRRNLILVAMLLLATVIVLWLAFTTWRAAWSALAGVLIAVLIMIKTALVLWPLFLAPLWLAGAVKQRSWRPIFQGALAALVLVAIVLPWTIRNYRVLDAWPVLSTNGGATFWRSNNPTSDGGGTYPEGTLQRHQEAGEQERSELFYRDGWDYLAQNKSRIPWLFHRKTRMLLDPFYPSRLAARRACNWWYCMLCPPALVGFFVLGKRHPQWNAVVVMTVLQSAFVTLLFHGYPRYRFPYETFLALWAMAGAAEVSARIRSGRAMMGLVVCCTTVHAILFAMP